MLRRNATKIDYLVVFQLEEHKYGLSRDANNAVVRLLNSDSDHDSHVRHIGTFRIFSIAGISIFGPYSRFIIRIVKFNWLLPPLPPSRPVELIERYISESRAAVAVAAAEVSLTVRSVEGFPAARKLHSTG